MSTGSRGTKCSKSYANGLTGCRNFALRSHQRGVVAKFRVSNGADPGTRRVYTLCTYHLECHLVIRVSSRPRASARAEGPAVRRVGRILSRHFTALRQSADSRSLHTASAHPSAAADG